MSQKELPRKNYILAILVVFLIVTASYYVLAQRYNSRNILDDPEVVDFKVGPLVSKGIVPFNSIFGVTYYNPGTSKIRNIYWDFNGDGEYEIQGLQSSQFITDPTAQNIPVTYVVEVYNTETGTISNFTRISNFQVEGYNALMTLTFDDGHKTVFDNALSILNEKNIAATAYIVPAWVDWNGNYMTWEEIQELKDSGWDIGSHGLGSTNFTYCTEHNISLGTPCNQLVIHPKLSLLNQTRVIEELSESKRILQEHGFPASNFAYPHGGWNSVTYNLTKEYYNSARITNDSLNYLPENMDKHLIQVKGTNDLVKSQATYLSYIDQAVQSKSWLVLNNHIISDGSCELCLSPSRLSNLIDYAQSNRVKIVTVQEAISGSWKR